MPQSTVISPYHVGILLPLAAAGGCGLLQTLPAIPPLSWALVLIPLAVVAIHQRLPPILRVLLLILLFAAIGFFYAAWRADWRLTESIPSDLVWQDVTVEGTIKGAPSVDPNKTQIDFFIERVVAPRLITLNIRARLSDYHHHSQPLATLKENSHLRLRVRLRPPAGSFNPYNFDYAGYLFAHNIRLIGYLRDRQNIGVIQQPTSWQPRQRIRQRLTASQARQTPLLAALILGDRSRLSDNHWRVLRRTGTAHLVSVSGTHIGLIYLLIASVIGFLWRRQPRLLRLMPTTRAALLLSLPAAFIYAWLAGWGVPIQRSFIMVATAALVLLYGGLFSPHRAICLAMGIVILIDPWVVISPGFWLSFILTCTVIIAVCNRSGGWLRRLLLMQCLASVIAIPLTLWFFNEAALLSPLANLIAIPIIGFVVLPLALAGIFLGDGSWLLAGYVADGLWYCLQWLSALPFASWSPAQAPLWLFILALLGGAWLLLPRGVPHRAVGLLPVLAMLFWQAPTPAPGNLRLTVLDVGQGNALVAQTTDTTTVYDTGRPYGGVIIASYLRGLGIRRINQLIISHPDEDHSGGWQRLAEAIPIDRVIRSEGPNPCQRGQQWLANDVSFEILHPGTNRADNRNDNSCVLLIRTANGQSVLLTGDISDDVEATLVPQLDPVTALLVAHHGSQHATSQTLLNTTQPTIAIISVGRNTYNHPHPDVLKRLQTTTTSVYRTDEHGAIVLQLGTTPTIVNHYRQRQQRYWHQ